MILIRFIVFFSLGHVSSRGVRSTMDLYVEDDPLKGLQIPDGELYRF